MKNPFLPLAAVTIITWSWLIWLTIGINGQPKVAYVHSEYLFENYLGTIESYKVLETKTEKWGNNLDSLSQTYRIMYDKYEAEATQMKKEEKEEAGRLLQQKQEIFTNYHQSVEKMKTEEDQKLTQSVIKQIDAYVKEFAAEHGYDMIVSGGNNGGIIYGEKSFDITDQVLVYVNKKYKGG